MHKPALIVVSGAPGTGKTAMGRRISEALRLPGLSKDLIKESLYDTLGTTDREWSRRLGHASMALLFRLIETQLEAGRSAIAESNFYVEFDSPRFERLKARYDFRLVEVHCQTERGVLHRRMKRRSASGERHPGHVETPELYAEFDAALARGSFDPLNVGEALICVDTTRLSLVDYEQVVARVRDAAEM